MSRPRGHIPGVPSYTKNKPLPVNRNSGRSAVSAMRDLDHIVRSSSDTIDFTIARMGVSETTWYNWKTGRRAPNLLAFEAAVNALGYEVVLRKRE